MTLVRVSKARFSLTTIIRLCRARARVSRLKKGKNQLSSRVPLMHVEQGSNNFLSDADVTARFPGVSVPKYADINWTLASDSIFVTWTTDIGTNGSAQIFKSEAGKPSALKAAT